jgi:predicted nucleotidyltransferase
MKEHDIKDLSEKIAVIFSKIEEVEFAYLFGSFAREMTFPLAMYISVQNNF